MLTTYYFSSFKNLSEMFICVIFFSHVIVLGDVNTSHRPIDHCDPSDIVSKRFEYLLMVIMLIHAY